MFPYILPFWLAYIEARPDLAAWTKTTYARVARHLRSSGVEPVEGVVNLAGYMAERQAAGLHPRSMLLELRIAAAAFRWAQRAGLVGSALRLEMPRLHIDGVEGASKTGVRTFPLDEALRRALAGRSGRGEAPLLDLDGVTAPKQALERRFRTACTKAGIPAFTPHSLRRMVVKSLLSASVDAKTAASLTGHSVVTMIRFYQEITDEDRRDAIEQAHLADLEEEVAPTAASEPESEGSCDPDDSGSLEVRRPARPRDRRSRRPG